MSDVHPPSRLRHCIDGKRGARRLLIGPLLVAMAAGTGVSGLECFAQEVPQSPPANSTFNSGQFVRRPDASATATSAVDFETKEPFSATYVGADVANVVHEVLGDFLKIDYSVAPDVGGLVTMRLDNVRSRLVAINALRNALRPQGVAVIDRGDFVAIARAGGQDGPAQAAAISPGEKGPSGGGVVVLTPKYVAPSQLSGLIQPFAQSGKIPLIDDSRRFLLISGDEGSINAMSSAAAMFDVDWFSQVSTASFVLKHVRPQDLIAELKPLLGPSAGTVEFASVPRLSTLIVMARSPEVLRIVQNRIQQLDVPSSTVSAGMLLYRVKHVQAEDLAASVRELGGGSDAPAAASPQVAPAPSARPGVGPVQAPSTAPPLDGRQGDFVVSTNQSQNMVIVRGNSDQLAQAQNLLDALDQPPAQVLIEAAIVEITLTKELQMGVNWSGLQNKLAATFSDLPSGAIASAFPGLSVTYVNTDIQAALNLLASAANVEVMSRPTVMALNNETANLQVGDQVPIVTQSAVSVTNPEAPIVNQTTYRDTGVILKVTPQVRSAGMIELEIAQEVSQVARTTSSGIDSPTIQQRKVESKLMIPSGQSVALGGLISTIKSKDVVGVPLLKDLPLLGAAFRSTRDRVDRTELIVFLTPRLLVDGAASVEATDQLRKSFRKLEEELLKR